MSDNRKYNLQDSVLLQHGTVVLSMLPDDLEDFAGFDASYTPEKVAALESTLSHARAASTGDLIGDQLMQLTEVVTEAMASSNRTYRQIAYFVRRPFRTIEGCGTSLGQTTSPRRATTSRE